MSLVKGGKWLVLLGLAATLLVLSEASGLAQSDSPGLDTFRPPKSLQAAYVPGEVLVKFKNSPATFRGKPSREHFPSVQGAAAAEFAAALPAKAQDALAQVQGETVRAHPNIGLLRVKLPAHVSVSQAIDQLHRSGTVEYAEPNGVIIPQSIPSDPQFANQWGLHNTGATGFAGADIKAPEAWDIVYPGNIVTPGSTIVAVIDTGVDYLHEDLAANIWVNTGEIPGNLIDDDHNNFVDDYYGINTTVTPSSGNPMDTLGHGTAMAGIIGAVGNNAKGMAGINWQTRIMALKCMTTTSPGTVDTAITCINYALAQAQKEGVNVVLTLGWSQLNNTWSNALHDALRVAQVAGALVVTAAGNNDEDNDIFPNYPSSYNHDVKDFALPGVPVPPVPPANITMDNIISVGASDQFDKKWTDISYGSNYGLATVDLFAPGKDIVSTLPGSPENKYGKYTPTPPPPPGTGTSFAAAHVAGACALLWNQYPDEDWRQIKARILNGVDDGLAQDFHAICVTEGRLNLANSLQPPDTPNTSVPPNPHTAGNIPAVFSIFEVPPTTGTDPVVVPGRADSSDTLVITGVNFGASGTLSFLGTTFPAANILRWNTKDYPDQIVATVPADLPKGTGRLKVTNDARLTSRGACFSNISREKQVGSLIMARGLAASAQVNRDVYIIGGRTYWGTVPHVEKYSLDTNHTVVDSDWAIPTAVSNAGAASIGNKIYVVGGLWEDPVSGNTSLVPNLQIFDTAIRTWENGPPLPKALMQCAVVKLGAKLYVFGGLKSAGAGIYSAVTDSYVFDLATNAWSGIRVLPTATAYAAAAPTASGKIWVMGGFTTSTYGSQQRTVQEYDPATDQWTTQRHLVRPRGGAAGLRFGGQVYCLRGAKPPPSPFSNAIYDEYADGEWYNADPAWSYWMPSIMNYLGIFVSPPKVLDRKGLYTPPAGRYLEKIYLLGGMTGTEPNYTYSFSNKVWAFPAPGGGMEINTDSVGKGLAWIPALLLDD